MGRDRAGGPRLPGDHPCCARRLRAADGVVAPLTVSPVSIGRRAAPLDPIAVPGVESVERQGAPPRAGLAEPPTAGRRRGGPPSDGAGDAGPPAAGWPAPSTWTSPMWPGRQLLAAAGGLAVLYDLGAAVARSRPWPAWWTRPAAGQPARPRRPRGARGWLGQAAYGRRFPVPRGARRLAAPQGGGRRLQRPPRRRDRRRSHRCRRTRWSRSGWRRHDPAPHPRTP